MQLTILTVFRVEYTDCFGRSRQIPKKDLHKVQEQDEDLHNVAESRDQQVDQKEENSRSSKSTGEISEDENESVYGPDVGLQFMKQREEWQKQEELNKERTSIHYRDILFDGRSRSLETLSHLHNFLDIRRGS